MMIINVFALKDITMMLVMKSVLHAIQFGKTHFFDIFCLAKNAMMEGLIIALIATN